MGFPWLRWYKESVRKCGRLGFHPWVGKIPWWRERLPTPVFLPGEPPWTEEPGGLQSMESQRVGQSLCTLYIIYTSTTKELLKKKKGGGGNPRERKGDCGILLLYLSKLSKELQAFTPSLLGRIKTSGVPNPWEDYCLLHPSLSVYKIVIAKLLVSWDPGLSPSIHTVESPMFTSLQSWDVLWPMAWEQRRKPFKRKINFQSQWTVALLLALCLHPEWRQSGPESPQLHSRRPCSCWLTHGDCVEQINHTPLLLSATEILTLFFS